MTELKIAETRGQKNYYELVLLKVAGISQYRPQDLRFEGLEGFWNFSDMAGRDTGGRIPEVGVIGWFKLSGGNPKTGPNARPGSVYLDVDGFQKASDGEKAGYVTTEAIWEDHSAKNFMPSVGSPQSNTDPIQQRITIGMAFNNLTVMLASQGVFVEDEAPEMWQTWRSWFHEASRGLPLSPVTDGLARDEEDSGVEDDASEIVEQANAHLSDQPPTEDVEDLPW